MSERVIVAAEIGINHQGSLDTALKMVDAAADAGCDAVKVQVFKADEFCAPSAMYQGESQREMFGRYELGRESIAAIAQCCRDNRVKFFGTATSAWAADALLHDGAVWLKIGSDDITNHELLRYVGGKTSSVGWAGQNPVGVILSTGMASEREIHAALHVLRLERANVWGLLHCTSLYPCPDAAVNLRRLYAHGLFMGFSDHTEGHEAAIAAVAMGASMVEKHFSLDRGMPGPDHKFSETPQSMAALVKSIRRVEAMLGDGLIDPQPEEMRMYSRYTARRFVVAARDMVCGTRLVAADMEAKRCAADHECFDPPEMPGLCGRVLAREMAAGEPIRMGDVE